jgi:hypothetical protein
MQEIENQNQEGQVNVARAAEASRKILESDFSPYHAELLPSVEHASYFGGKVEVIEATPLDAKTHERVERGDLDVYYAHGAGWAQEEPTIIEMAKQGRKAFAMDFIGARKPDARFVLGHTALGDTGSFEHATDKEIAALLGGLKGVVPRQQMREAATLLALIAERNGSDSERAKPIDAVFQSESAGHGIVAAYSEPEAFRKIVLAFPGSLSGPQTGFIPHRVLKDSLVRRRHRPAPDNDFRSTTKISPLTSVRMQLKSPGFKEDAAALRYSSLAWMLHSMRQKENAPGVTLVAGLDDKIFELEDFIESLVDAADVDRIIVVPGGHAIGGRKDVLGTVLSQLSTDESEVSKGSLAERIVLPENISSERKEEIMRLVADVDMRSAQS